MVKKETKNKNKPSKNILEDKKKVFALVGFVIFIAVIVGIVIFLNVRKDEKIESEDDYETIVEQNDRFIHYQFNFQDADEDHEYQIKDYNLTFKIDEDGKYTYDFGGDDEVTTLARKYDVYYMKKLKTIIVVDINEFGMGLNYVTKDGIDSITEFLEGAFSIDNVSIDEKSWKFDVIKYSDNNLVVTPSSIFNVCFNNYLDYTDDDYAVVETYEYDLSKDDFTLDDFEVTKKMTIKELIDDLGDRCDDVENIEIIKGDESYEEN